MAGTKVSALTAGAALGGTEALPAVQTAATVKITAAQIKTFTSDSPTLVTPVLGVATGTSLALGGATIGSDALAVTGTSSFSGNLISAGRIIAQNGTMAMWSQGLSVGSAQTIAFSSTSTYSSTPDVILSRAATATLRHGDADAASPVAQTIKFQDVVAGTSNTAGVNATIQAPAGTGTGAGGSLIFQVAAAGSSGTAKNAWATALTIASNGNATFASDIVLRDAYFNRDIGSLRNIIGQKGYSEMVEMTAPAAPATDSVRLYAEDDGAGKTRLMALFATGAAQQVAIEP